MSYFFLAASIVSNFLGQLLMKYAADRINFNGSFNSGLIKSIFLSPYVIIGAVFYFLGMLTWLLTLSKLELSFAYPFMAITYVLVTFAAFILFKEPLTILRILGIVLIFSGVVVLSLGANSKG